MVSPAPLVRSVYVHAPFCVRRCQYCDFAVQVRKIGDLEGWIAALAGELRYVEHEGRFPLATALDTLYVGGGTPSLLGPGAMDALAGLIGRDRLREPQLEWTAEANPESFTPDVAAAWGAAGLNRLSLGVQTFSEPALRWMGRMHGPDGARAAVATARRAGLDNFSVDLIFALPEGVERDWTSDLEAALALEPPHVSLYGLTAEANTPLGKSVAEGRVATAPEERYREEYLEAVERLTAAGFQHYEVSNFALPGRDSRHNRVYWEGGAYLGLGNGAHSYSDPLRRWNVREWDDYARAAAERRTTVAGEEELDADARRLERVWLGLRTDRGVAWSELTPRARLLARGWEEAGLARIPAEGEGEAVRLTAEGWLVLDRLSVELDHALGSARQRRAEPQNV